MKAKLIETDGFDLLLPLLLLLDDEIAPQSQIKLDLYLGKVGRSKHQVRTQKNYTLLTHRLIVRSWIGLVLSIATYSILSMVNPQLFPQVIPLFVLPILIVFYVFIYMIVFYIAGSAFGPSPKVKARFLKAPRMLVQARLADGTLFQADLNHWVIQKTAFKKKVKFKNFQLHKKKKKYKAKAVMHLRLAFPQKRYKMHSKEFEKKFDQKPFVAGKQVAKMKLKPGEKRQTVVYQHVKAKQGTGHDVKTLPYPTFKQFTQLVVEGGYHRLRNEPQPSSPQTNKARAMQKNENRVKIEQAEAKYTRDNLTLIKGVGRTTQIKLNNEGVIAFQQIAEMELSDFEEMLRHLDLPFRKARDWQNQAKSLA